MCLHVYKHALTHTLTCCAYIHIYAYTGSQVQSLVVSVLFLCCGLWACLQGWSMIFYCFPRIIGRVHREGKAIHQSTAKRERESEREERGQRVRERGMEGERGVGGISMKMEGKIEEGRWEEKQGEERAREIEGMGRARWRQRGEGGDIQMCSWYHITWKCMEKIEEQT